MRIRVTGTTGIEPAYGLVLYYFTELFEKHRLLPVAAADEFFKAQWPSHTECFCHIYDRHHFYYQMCHAITSAITHSIPSYLPMLIL
jgi:hypothetical protein